MIIISQENICDFKSRNVERIFFQTSWMHVGYAVAHYVQTYFRGITQCQKQCLTMELRLGLCMSKKIHVK